MLFPLQARHLHFFPQNRQPTKNPHQYSCMACGVPEISQLLHVCAARIKFSEMTDEKNFSLMHDGGGCYFYHELLDDLHLCPLLELPVGLLLPQPRKPLLVYLILFPLMSFFAETTTALKVKVKHIK